ncbi:hypothetical protein [Rhodococcus sp. B10]|uniref:hypothetical protein n=1 Tax=Rhodococcus sp. B10 TaxID=2695876 RepID=UPI0014311B6F|nr:hypothetical protein [Rhodococcus sp. B10]NIL77588.1 hypothetical protein [Rhodococcus sp. B10]
MLRRAWMFMLGGRKVISGSWPLYRICMLMLTISGAFQLITGKVPGSVSATNSPEWTDIVYMWMQFLGGAVTLASLTIGWRDISAAMGIERVGAVLVAFSSLIYVMSVVDYNSGPPTSSGVWLVIGVGTYCAYRVFEISDTFREAERKRREC